MFDVGILHIVILIFCLTCQLDHCYIILTVTVGTIHIVRLCCLTVGIIHIVMLFCIIHIVILFFLALAILHVVIVFCLTVGILHVILFCVTIFRSLLWFTINYVALSCARGISLRSATPRRSALAIPRR